MDLTQCSSSTLRCNITGANQHQDEIDELRNAEEIKIWGIKQEDLEQQALNEIEKFAEHRYNGTEENLEDGEILDKVEKPIAVKVQKLFSSLDVHSYIKRQEELKKRSEHVKHSLVSEKSRHVYTVVAKKQSESLTSKCKLNCKRSENGKRRKIDKEMDNSKQGKSSKSKTDSDIEYVPSEEDYSSGM